MNGMSAIKAACIAIAAIAALTGLRYSPVDALVQASLSSSAHPLNLEAYAGWDTHLHTSPHISTLSLSSGLSSHPHPAGLAVTASSTESLVQGCPVHGLPVRLEIGLSSAWSAMVLSCLALRVKKLSLTLRPLAARERSEVGLDTHPV